MTDREPGYSLEKEVISITESLDALANRARLLGFQYAWGFNNTDPEDTASPPWKIALNSGADEGLEVDFYPMSDDVVPLGIGTIDYRFHFPRKDRDLPERGSLVGWVYLNRSGEIAKSTDIAKDDQGDTDEVIVEGHNPGEIAIIDRAAFDSEHAPTNIEGLRMAVGKFSQYLDDLLKSSMASKV